MQVLQFVNSQIFSFLYLCQLCNQGQITSQVLLILTYNNNIMNSCLYVFKCSVRSYMNTRDSGLRRVTIAREIHSNSITTFFLRPAFLITNELPRFPLVYTVVLLDRFSCTFFETLSILVHFFLQLNGIDSKKGRWNEKYE